MMRAARFLANYLPNRPFAGQETCFGDTRATLYRGSARRGAPGWVVLHGITAPGRGHPALVRFARALAGSGGLVLVPEIPAWRSMRIAPEQAQETIRASVEHLARHPDVQSGGVGLVGFSFGATQALVAAADPSLKESLHAVVGFGGYCDLRRTFTAMLTGEHEWDGVRYQMRPDPYGRWIVAGNYLTRIPEYAGMSAAAESLRALAREAGRRGVFAGDPELDAVNATLRARLDTDEQHIWDLLAPLAGEDRVETAAAEAFASRLAAAGIGAEPLLDPRPFLEEVRCRVVLAHGREDRLIPFTESLRLQRMLPPESNTSATITGLFAHSSRQSGVPVAAYAREAAQFVRLLHHALGAV